MVRWRGMATTRTAVWRGGASGWRGGGHPDRDSDGPYEAASSLVPRLGARAGRRHYLAAAIC